MLWVIAALIALWLTEPLHGIDSALVALIGALAVTAPAAGSVAFKDALKQVDWNILIFLAATLELGEALIESGGARWLVGHLFELLSASVASSPVLVFGVVAAISLLSHLVITSRTARSSVLVPLVVLLGASLGYDPALLAFMSTAAAGFCLTLPVSAKPVLMFRQLDRPTFDSGDLLRLSRVLLPVHFALLLAFSLFVWPALGMSSERRVPQRSPDAPSWNARAQAGASAADDRRARVESGERSGSQASPAVGQPRRGGKTVADPGLRPSRVIVRPAHTRRSARLPGRSFTPTPPTVPVATSTSPPPSNAPPTSRVAAASNDRVGSEAGDDRSGAEPRRDRDEPTDDTDDSDDEGGDD